MTSGYGYRSYATGGAAETDDWSRMRSTPGYVSQTVISETEVRRRPILSYTSPQSMESYGVRTEKRPIGYDTPSASVHRQTYPDRLEDYGVAHSKLPSPVLDFNRPKEVEDFITRVQTEVSKPRFNSSNASNWLPKSTGFNSSTPRYSEQNGFTNKDYLMPAGHANRSDYHEPKSPAYDSSYAGYGEQNVFKILDHLQPVSKANRNDYYDPKSTSFNSSTGGYGEQNDFHHKDYRNDNFDDYYRKPIGATELGMSTSNALHKPRRETWVTKPENSLTTPTSDIGTAIGQLIEVAKPFDPYAAQSLLTEPALGKAFGAKESDKRYGKYNFSSRPYTTRI